MVTDTVWLGSTAATAKLELLTLPETATEVWGEVSADGGRTWARWENFQLREDDSGYAAMFSLSDSSPRHFRVRTSNSRAATGAAVSRPSPRSAHPHLCKARK